MNLSINQDSMADTPPLRKFMFDRSFDGATSANKAERPRGPVTLKPEQLDALKQEAFEQGFASGKSTGIDQHIQQQTSLLEHIDAKLSNLVMNLSGLQKEQDEQLRQTILVVAKKLLPSYIERNGIEEVSAMLAEVIAEMVHEPRLVVRVHDSEFDIINTKIHEITVQKAYAGKVVVLADVEIARGDCRVEWADGGIERNVKATWQNIEQVLTPTPIPQTSTDQE